MLVRSPFRGQAKVHSMATHAAITRFIARRNPPCPRPNAWLRLTGSGSGDGTLVKRSLRSNQKCVDPAIKTDVPQ
jgi:hypothetical protein